MIEALIGVLMLGLGLLSPVWLVLVLIGIAAWGDRS